MHPRWAIPEDNTALIELVRACPMDGAIRIYFDRGPDFFVLSSLQGGGAKVCVIEDRQAGRLAASAALAEMPRVFVDGEVRSVLYACDLRVRPERRGGLLVKRIYEFLTEYTLSQGADLGITTVMASNEAMKPVLRGKAAVVRYIHVATMRNFAVQFLIGKREDRHIEVRPAQESDIPAMVELWNRVQAGKQFAPAWDEASFRAHATRSPGLSIGNYYLAFRQGKLAGLCLTWDQQGFKRMVVLGFSPGLRRRRWWYNPLARLLKRAVIPGIGNPVPYFYVTQLCAETPADLRALLVRIYNGRLGPRYLFFSTMLDIKDPLISALDGFLANRFDIELYAMDPQRKWENFPFASRPAYFDPAMV